MVSPNRRARLPGPSRPSVGVFSATLSNSAFVENLTFFSGGSDGGGEGPAEPMELGFAANFVRCGSVAPDPFFNCPLGILHSSLISARGVGVSGTLGFACRSSRGKVSVGFLQCFGLRCFDGPCFALRCFALH